jgi:RNA polymerase sigma-70 factor (ECF subfamily)
MNEHASMPRAAAWRQQADLSDDQLITRVRAHDAAAFEALMRRYNRRLFRVAVSVLRDSDAAEDAVQETYIRAFTRLDSFKGGMFGAWLARVAYNEALMIQRRQRAGTASLEAEAEDGTEPPLSEPALGIADRFAEALHARTLLEHAVHALPDTFRPVFMLRMVEGLSVAETAECLALNATTVRTRLHRAQHLMRAHIEARFGDQARDSFDFAGERCDRIVARVLERVLNCAGDQPVPLT